MGSGILRIGVIILAAYLLGAIPFAQLVSRARGVDIFSVGSGNAGFTNVLRVLGGRTASIVLVGDILKGTLAAGIGDWLGNEWGMLLASAVAVLAHTLSIFVHFRGGKGVATGAGVLLYVSPLSFLVCGSTLALLAYTTGYMSLGSLAAAVLCPIMLVLTDQHPVVIAVFTCCALFVIWKHRSNIRRLRAGTENKIRPAKKR
ncbi:glycerol-3-phosphate 1-O-acyltransferase PlsY [Peptococcus simiae]|uniref:Glycerol-3-phosphate acyltransferase n=1 Tax=Peptococcus simiae TaxID=1643805 RepID=A0ABW9H0U6_9FIRM